MAQNDIFFRESYLRQPSSKGAFAGRRRSALLLILMASAVIAVMVHSLMPLSWNVTATRAVQSLDFPGLQPLMLVISGFGNAPKLVAIALIALLACNKRVEAFWLAFSGLGGWLLSMGLKPVFANPRPTAELVNVYHQWPNGSFPSGHLVFYLTFFGFIFFIAREQMARGSVLRRAVMLVAMALILLVSFSRVFLGEHWVSDVPGSYVLGAIWLAVSLKLYRAWKRARRRPHDWYLPYRATGK